MIDAYTRIQTLPCPEILTVWNDLFSELFEQNVTRSIPPEPPNNTIENARWRDTVNALCTPPDTEDMAAAIALALADFTDNLPPLATVPYKDLNKEREAQFTVPLKHVVNVLKLVDVLTYGLIIHNDKLFPKLKDQFIDNCMRLSPKKPIFPSNYKGDDPLQFLAGTPLLKLFEVQVPVSIPEEARFMGHWIVAPSGKGKTTLLFSMLLDDSKKDACIILMDAKGELVNEVRHWQPIKDRLVIIDPNSEYPIQLNPLDGTHAIDNLMYLFSSLLDSGLTGKQAGLFRSCIRATLYAPEPTINTLSKIINEGVADVSALPEDLQIFFKQRFRDSTYNQTKEEIHWRIHTMMENPALRAMFNAPKTLLDLGQLMDEGKVVVIDNTKNKVGESGSEFFGRFFLFLILNEAIKRSGRKGEKKPVYVYIDEANKVIRRDESFETLLDTCRSERIAFVVAHQRVAQIDEPKVLDALANCGVRMANVEEDASYLASKLDTTADELRRLRRGQFATNVRDYGAFTVAVAKPAMPAHMTADEEQVLQQQTRAKYCDAGTRQTMVHPDAPRQVIDPDKLSTEAKKDW